MLYSKYCLCLIDNCLVIISKPNDGLISESMTKVLLALDNMAPGRSGRTLAASCEMSVAQVNNILRRLESIGIVFSESVPPAKRYFLNREHVLALPLLQLVRARSTVFNWLKERLMQLHGLDRAIVFGSVARGEDIAESDLDLLLVFKAEIGESGEESLQRIAEDFFRLTGNELNPILRKMSDVTPKLISTSPLLQTIALEGQSIIGKGLGEA